MRKFLCAAVCVLVLTSAGVAQALVVSGVQTTRPQITTALGQPAPSMATDAGKDSLKTQVVFDTQTSPVHAAGEEKTDSALLLLAGLLVMGVIIRRRSTDLD